MKWFSDTASRIFSTIVAGAAVVAMVGPVGPSARLAALRGDLRSVEPIVIAFDPGGFVEQAELWYHRIRESHVPVRLAGECDSACTLVLILPKTQVCVEDGARLGFHQVRLVTDKAGDPKRTYQLIHTYYPPAVQAWLDKQGALTLDIIYMYADEIVSLGIFPHC